MFFVLNKSKIYSYIIALGTVLILFAVATNIVSPINGIVETSTNIIEGNILVNTQKDITKNIVLSE